MFTTNEEVTGAQKAAVQTCFDVANEAVSGFEKLVRLNLEELHGGMQRAMTALANGELPGASAIGRGDLSAIERVALYNRQALDIIASTQAAIIKRATAQYETRIGAVQANLDEAAQRAPASAEVAVTAMNSAITAANAFYESVWKTARQAIEAAESNLDVVTRHATNTSHAA
ncbi:phasin family protein [Paraburkholderia sp. LEh10]|uniref:phasin family protein n=1 Tax=Paraburkholderia sp. LEh10 TaxID=2821353 RepID=UPI001AE40ACB|nr:phasin family protein [Paraburkholderia sp. LEh10]MBP0591956.1 phasin family protein [Paraburkholderia sp. LEh10]